MFLYGCVGFGFRVPGSGSCVGFGFRVSGSGSCPLFLFPTRLGQYDRADVLDFEPRVQDLGFGWGLVFGVWEGAGPLFSRGHRLHARKDLCQKPSPRDSPHSQAPTLLPVERVQVQGQGLGISPVYGSGFRVSVRRIPKLQTQLPVQRVDCRWV